MNAWFLVQKLLRANLASFRSFLDMLSDICVVLQHGRFGGALLCSMLHTGRHAAGKMTDRSIMRIAPLLKPQECGIPNFKIAQSLAHPAEPTSPQLRRPVHGNQSPRRENSDRSSLGEVKWNPVMPRLAPAAAFSLTSSMHRASSGEASSSRNAW